MCVCVYKIQKLAPALLALLALSESNMRLRASGPSLGPSIVSLNTIILLLLLLLSSSSSQDSRSLGSEALRS